jgi:hypothetical protein
MNVKKCKCGADISFIEMASGKKMPVDAKPEQMIILDDALEVVFKWRKNGNFEQLIGEASGEIGFMIKAYRPHWGTCPLAKEFKKKKKGD